MAPEIPSKKYEGQSVDIFAAGVILFIMYAGNPPFEKATPNDPYYKILKDKKYDIFWKAHSRKRPVGFFSESFNRINFHPRLDQVACLHPCPDQGLIPKEA